MVIDVRNKLKEADFQTLANKLEYTSKIAIILETDKLKGDDRYVIECTLFNVANKLFSDEVKQYIKANTDNIYIMAENDDVVIISGADYFWWSENTRRLNKLKKAFIKTDENITSKNDVKQLVIACANISDEGFTDIEINAQEKNAQIVWMNTQLIKRFHISDDTVVVFCFDYIEGDENNIDKWMTLNQLVEQGRVTLQ